MTSTWMTSRLAQPDLHSSSRQAGTEPRPVRGPGSSARVVAQRKARRPAKRGRDRHQDFGGGSLDGRLRVHPRAVVQAVAWWALCAVGLLPKRCDRRGDDALVQSEGTRSGVQDSPARSDEIRSRSQTRRAASARVGAGGLLDLDAEGPPPPEFEEEINLFWSDAGARGFDANCSRTGRTVGNDCRRSHPLFGRAHPAWL